jgi:hypothetical protein
MSSLYSGNIFLGRTYQIDIEAFFNSYGVGHNLKYKLNFR